MKFEKEPFPVELQILLIILLLSSIFLVITILVYTFSPQIESFHRKCVIFYAANQAATFIALTVKRYMPLYSSLASMFWLNSMCIDIFFAYEGVIRTGKYYFANFAAYSSCLPIAIVVVALISNRIDDEDSIFNPNIGNRVCTLNGTGPVWLYYQGPSLILLLANLGLLFATCGNSEPFSTMEETVLTVPQGKERRRKYLIMTLLEGYSFVQISSQYFFDIDYSIVFIGICLDVSRGIFVFLLLVCADMC
ncbi:probable G-protein coupled receptor Mth-like 11 [Cloeon dipterum]|uniref:probable G-protein coupled receptor Mth-like 11 n=1 Tax=Cloeon dipterum TaxID=197152 RepID=UPI00321F61EA